MTAPFEIWRHCSHVAPDSCPRCSGDSRDSFEASRQTPADRARIAAENTRQSPLIAAAWAVPVDEAIRQAREYARVVAEQRKTAVATNAGARRAWLESFPEPWRDEMARRTEAAYGPAEAS